MDNLLQADRRPQIPERRPTSRRKHDSRLTSAFHLACAMLRATCYHSAWATLLASQVLPRPSRPRRLPARHSALVRVTHWITTLCFFALLVTGVEIVISHPRFYWGETGNVLDSNAVQYADPFLEGVGADRLRVRAAGPERLEPVSPLSSGLGAGIDRLALCNLRLLHRAFPEKPAPGRGRSFVAGVLDARSLTICASSGRVRQKPGRITCCSGSPTCS